MMTTVIQCISRQLAGATTSRNQPANPICQERQDPMSRVHRESSGAIVGGGRECGDKREGGGCRGSECMASGGGAVVAAPSRGSLCGF